MKILPMLIAAASLTAVGCASKPITKSTLTTKSKPIIKSTLIAKSEPITNYSTAIPGATPQKVNRVTEGQVSPCGFSEKGEASWYGQKYHGRQTASGEFFDMYRMTAAHKHLPLPSYVLVRNLENNRQVIVRVNDRGPFIKGRIIDLSRAAANELGFVNQGVAKVEIAALDTYDPECYISF